MAEVQDEVVIQQIENLLKPRTDFWDEPKEYEKALIKQGLSDLEQGKRIDFQSFMKERRNPNLRVFNKLCQGKIKIPLQSKEYHMKQTKVSIFQPGVEESLVADLRSGKSLPEVMAPLIKRILEAGLEGELNHHLSEERTKGDSSNRRNGKAPKTLRSEYGPVGISPSRDRNGSFEPELVGKRDRQLGLGL